MIDSSGYRKNVGIILVNSSSELLICKRFKEQSWQFPQGGFKKNETAESAMYRELYEEVGLKKNDVLIIGRTKEWLKYELPKKYQRKTNMVFIKTCYRRSIYKFKYFQKTRV